METKHKNILIAGLLAVVLVMAVGYAAFATQLEVEGTANITSKWDVHFDKANQAATDVTAYNGFTSSTITNDASCASTTATPCGKITYDAGSDSPLTADIYANLKQPGDKITFSLRIVNAGTIGAQSAKPSLSGSGFTIVDTGEPQTAKKGHILFTVSQPASTTLAASGNTTMQVTAEFVDDVAARCEKDGSTIEAADSAACTTAGGEWKTATTGNMNAEEIDSAGALKITLNYSQAS